MRRYKLTLIFAMAVIGLYHFIDVRLFNLDFAKRTKEALFIIRPDPLRDETISLFNIGKLQSHELQIKIDSLLMAEPGKIGINLCHFGRVPEALMDKYKSDDRVVFVNCGNSGTGTLSQIIGEQNTVTHFRTDNPDYFELRLTDVKGRGNETERINYGPRFDYPINKRELTDLDLWYNPDSLKGKTILLGYMGDHLKASIHYFKNCRITPLNTYYGESAIQPDMYDIEISANIMRTLNQEEYIHETNQFFRILIILAITLLNVILLTLAKTKSIIANLIIATILFILLTGAGSFLIVFLFQKGIYLEIDELPLILLITTAITVIVNISEKRASPQHRV